MIRTASPSDLPALRELFGRSNDAPYDLTVVAEEKCFGAGIAGEPVARVFERDERLLGAVVTCGKWVRILAVDRSYRRQGIGSALLRDAESRGASVIGAEPGNYFTPGVLESEAAFFVNRGYTEKARTRNLIWTAAAMPPLSIAAALPPQSILDFVESEFGPIWRFEASKAFEQDPPTIVIEEHGGQIAGFAAYDVNNRGLGSFGPMGVAKSLRNRGIGCRLTLAALAGLKALGYDEVVIPWTDAVDFYARCCNARPAHQFISFRLP